MPPSNDVKAHNGKIESASFHKLLRDVQLQLSGQVPFRFSQYVAHVIMEEHGGAYSVILYVEDIQAVFG